LKKKPKCQTFYFRLLYRGSMLPVISEAVCPTRSIIIAKKKKNWAPRWTENPKGRSRQKLGA